ncbi:MAG TPA: YdcF family protein [Beijerinckiaceae bacterium]|nr:YdcF family protein [Beijerinckiaceae bacterium]
MPGASEATEIVGWGWQDAAKPARSRPRASVLTLLLKAAVLAVAAVAVAAFAGFVAFVGAIERYERTPVARADAMVVLTGGSQRVSDAVELLAKGYAGRLLITGVNERTTREEIARSNPGQKELFACCVDLDYRARNTIGNAIETRRWLRDHSFDSVIVVTSSYHMPRTLVEFENALPAVTKVPHAVVSDAVQIDGWWRSPGTARLLASEYAKFLIVWLRTRFERDPERSRAAVLIGRGEPVRVAQDRHR